MGHAAPPRELEPLAYDISEAAQVSRRGRTRIKRAIAAGELRAKKEGRSTIILESDLRRWLAQLPDRPRPVGDSHHE
jgi:hypothetical protein